MALIPPYAVTIDPAVAESIKSALDVVEKNVSDLPQADLDGAAIGAMQTIDDVREPFVLRTIEQHAMNFPAIVPPFLSLPDATANMATRKTAKAMLKQVDKIKEQLEELVMRAEHNSFHFMRKVFDQAKDAEDSGTVPGVGTVVRDLAQLFEGQGVREGGVDVDNVPPIK